MISFKASYINSQLVQRFDTADNAHNQKVAFVELNPESTQDLESVYQVHNYWDNGESFAQEIFEKMRDCNWLGFNNGLRFFALTNQVKNFKNLKPYNILGLVSIIEGDDQLKIKHLQVDPENNYHSRVRSYKGIGKAIIKSLTQLFSDKNIVLESVESAINFYKKIGLEQISNSRDFILRR